MIPTAWERQLASYWRANPAERDQTMAVCDQILGLPDPDDFEDIAGESIVKRGDSIFDGTDYPRTWEGFVGQEGIKEQLRVMVGSAKARGTRIEHTLLASGIAGVGKTTLATLMAHQAGAGFVQTTGPLTQWDALGMIRQMQDGDVLFIDEAHRLVQGGQTKADWLLPFMTEGKFYTANGAEKVPNVALIAATTDVGVLPETLISRFMVQPAIATYSNEEGSQIAMSLAERMKLSPLPDWDAARAVARAADNNPRVMRKVLTQVRDLSYAYPDTFPNLGRAFDWAGVSPDGLSVTAREVLLALLLARDHTAALDTIRASLGEPGPIRHHEKQLLQHGLIEVTGRGRKLTDAGLGRAKLEASLR